MEAVRPKRRLLQRSQWEKAVLAQDRAVEVDPWTFRQACWWAGHANRRGKPGSGAWAARRLGLPLLQHGRPPVCYGGRGVPPGIRPHPTERGAPRPPHIALSTELEKGSHG